MYFILSFNYRNSDVTLRSKLANLKLEDFADFKEVMLLSTCNRIEIIFDKKWDLNELYDKVFYKVITPEEMIKAEIYEEDEAIEHIFKVAASLDSMVVGETQITGQLKEAFYEAYEKHFIGKDLTRLIHFSFKCAKKIRNQTNISSEPVSIASIAVKKAKEELNDLSGYSAIVVGVGDTARIVCKNLIKEGVNIILVNRTVENAFSLKEELGDEVNIDVHSLDSLPKLINNYRLLFTATASNEPIIKKEFIKETKFKRLWFDLAIPNDIEDISCINIKIIKVDDLKEISEKNLKKRENELKNANRIIKKCVEEYKKYLNSVSVEPTIKFLQDKAHECAKRALKNAVKKHYIPAELEEEVEKVLHNAFKRFLHHPNMTLRKMSDSPEVDLFISVIKRLFGENDLKMDMNKCEYHMEKGIFK
ncbi:glutamyl-tRNA reductase [Caminibacter mediatlanticus TB-2]|uniref:Glutamyl-tRNA reductase n=1 Tax=Caminibacter mediatlanticus TB-2 TaxID=391592 RepID=A0AAI9F2P4_9BACT|nr:glutamyl-tRNA reductase [Caminibacter mediatlanticus]EDM24018.1 glutamyl-tRNA reductase [Caminibacter mediatlanticus TB-2]QCT94375.1 glutamyl-tRNA reductase [Caminibacter mediatlanticus TB-2]